MATSMVTSLDVQSPTSSSSADQQTKDMIIVMSIIVGVTGIGLLVIFAPQYKY